MEYITEQINEYVLSSDKRLLQIDVIYNYLSQESYWAKNIPLSIVKQAIESSECFGIYFNDKQIGFARVVTDKATFAYLADVFILPDYRGRGLSKQLMVFIMKYPSLQGLRRFMLATKDAHGLYKQFGFAPIEQPDRLMGIKFFDHY